MADINKFTIISSCLIICEIGKPMAEALWIILYLWNRKFYKLIKVFYHKGLQGYTKGTKNGGIQLIILNYK